MKNNTIANVKNESSNLNTMTSAFKCVVKCEVSCLEENFQRTSFQDVFSKACQYAVDEKVCRKFKCVSIKFAQINFQKCITWSKKYGKGQHERNKYCIEFDSKPRKLNTPMKTKLVLFPNFFFLLWNFQ